MLEVTAAAAAKVRSLLEAQGKAAGSHALRVRVAGGGCSGFQYEMFFDDARDELDVVVSAGGVEVRVDPMSATYLKGSRLDYLDTLNESGFKIENPNAVSQCGCGKSFAA